jgi:hypothetical protein
MSQPSWLKKYLTLKPDVRKIFEDLEEWKKHCRSHMLRYDERDLYKSKEYKDYQRRKQHSNR